MDTLIPKPKRAFPHRVKTALSNGELWRAKEILQGTIGSSEYDPLLLEQYGLVLLQMGDLMEAGKYLFLSGQMQEEYQEAIALYLHRYGRRDWHTLVSTFPKHVRNIKTELLPESVQHELERLKIPVGRGQETPSQMIASSKSKFSDHLSCIACGCIAFVIGMCAIAGIVSFIQIISG